MKISWFALFLIILLRAVVFADEGRTVMEEVHYTISSQIDAFKKKSFQGRIFGGMCIFGGPEQGAGLQ